MDLALQLVSSAERTGDVPGKCSYGSRGEARVFFHVLLRQYPLSLPRWFRPPGFVDSLFRLIGFDLGRTCPRLCSHGLFCILRHGGLIDHVGGRV